jgi:hypothetical protein
MKIVRRERSWIHTHFVTDCICLPVEHEKETRRQMARVLAQERIVFGVHFEACPDEPGLSIVLECQPLPETLARIEAELATVIEPIPAKPRQTKVVVEAPPRRIVREKR